MSSEVYLVIKELEPSEQEVFICMSCLIKDATMQPSVPYLLSMRSPNIGNL